MQGESNTPPQQVCRDARRVAFSPRTRCAGLQSPPCSCSPLFSSCTCPWARQPLPFRYKKKCFRLPKVLRWPFVTANPRRRSGAMPCFPARGEAEAGRASEMMQILAGLSASVSQLSSKVVKQTSMLELQASASRLAEPPTSFSSVSHVR